MTMNAVTAQNANPSSPCDPGHGEGDPDDGHHGNGRPDHFDDRAQRNRALSPWSVDDRLLLGWQRRLRRLQGLRHSTLAFDRWTISRATMLITSVVPKRIRPSRTSPLWLMGEAVGPLR